MIGTPGHIFAATVSMGFMISGVRGGGVLLTSLRAPSVVTVIFGSSTSFCRVARTSSAEVPGKMRQFTLARARCGRALVAWPASSIVATQVVCTIPFRPGSCDRVVAACVSVGSLEKAIMAAPMGPGVMAPMRAK